MSAATALSRPNAKAGNDAGAERGWLSPLNLHWAGVGLLALVNLYLLAQIVLLWHAAGDYDAQAQARQRVLRTAADAQAEPLRGLDAKVAASTEQADRFYAERLPGVQSQVLTELGDLAKKSNVRMVRVAYPTAVVLAGTPHELTEMKMDASLSGDYRPLMLFINALERDRLFFVIDGVTLNGQQSGMVNLRLKLTTYLRGGADGSAPAIEGATGLGSASAPAASAGSGNSVRAGGSR